ncbi:MAG: hypothetical protein V1779_17720 [bacterium]
MENSKEIKPKGEDEIRELVIEEYGLDADDEANKPFIDKAVEKELAYQNERIENQKKLSKAIEQKKSWRDKATQVLAEEDDENLDENGNPKPKKDDTPQGQENEKLSKLEKEMEELKTGQHRQKYPNLTDEEYNSINALAKANGKTFEDTMENNPIAKNYLENAEVKQRVSGAIKAPSNRMKPGQTETEDDKIANELDSDLPTGFSSKKE